MSCRINFFNENVSYVIRNKRLLRGWFSVTIEKEGKVAGDINFILCDDDFLSIMNFKYLRHKSLTDILTFSSDNKDGLLSGDIFISLTRVKENAMKFNQKLEDELHRVMIHGVLHLIGYNDATKKERGEMREREDFYLGLYKINR
jgi:probable rRNA maturation factor